MIITHSSFFGIHCRKTSLAFTVIYRRLPPEYLDEICFHSGKYRSTPQPGSLFSLQASRPAKTLEHRLFDSCLLTNFPNLGARVFFQISADFSKIFLFTQETIPADLMVVKDKQFSTPRAIL